MTEPAYTDRALLYLLEELSPEERTAFEAELATDPALRRELRTAGADLVQWVDREIDPMPPPAHVWGEIAAALPETKAQTAAARPSRFSTLRRWQAAAAILLLLNVFWVVSSTLRPADQLNTREELATHTHGSPSAEAEGQRAEDALPSSVEDLQEALVAARREVDAWESTSGELSTQLSRASATNRALEDELRNWVSAATQARAEQSLLERRIGSFFALTDGRANLTVLELRPAGAPSSGIVDEVAQAIIDGNSGVVVETDQMAGENPIGRPGSPTGFMPETDLWTGIVTSSDLSSGGSSPTVDSSRSDADGQADSGSQIQNISSDAEPTGESQTNAGSEPAALAVWRSDQQQGFMNMYGLPKNSEGAQYFLWAREAGGDYVPVGILPEGSQGTVLLEFTVPQESFLPDSFLLTEEIGPEVTRPGEQIILTTPGGGE
jgi:hypothetical protein